MSTRPSQSNQRRRRYQNAMSATINLHAASSTRRSLWGHDRPFGSPPTEGVNRVPSDFDHQRDLGLSRIKPEVPDADRHAALRSLACAAPGIMASAIFVFLESLDEFTGTYFVGVPEVTTLPLLLFTASMEGNYQIAWITALVLLVPSVGFMLVIERFLKADVLAKVES
jgi:hypothetical protein